MLHFGVDFKKKHRELTRYLFFGVLSVLVNTATFLLLDKLLRHELIANTIAFLVTVQFAYLTNTKFVFKTAYTIQNFFQFWGMRIGTILIDNGGLWLLLTMKTQKLVAKCAVNIIVIGLNYLFSKFVIYKKEEDD